MHSVKALITSVNGLFKIIVTYSHIEFHILRRKYIEISDAHAEARMPDGYVMEERAPIIFGYDEDDGVSKIDEWFSIIERAELECRFTRSDVIWQGVDQFQIMSEAEVRDELVRLIQNMNREYFKGDLK